MLSFERKSKKCRPSHKSNEGTIHLARCMYIWFIRFWYGIWHKQSTHMQHNKSSTVVDQFLPHEVKVFQLPEPGNFVHQEHFVRVIVGNFLQDFGVGYAFADAEHVNLVRVSFQQAGGVRNLKIKKVESSS